MEIHQSRLCFLGVYLYPGCGGHITVLYTVFSPTGIPVSSEISLSYDNRNPFSTTTLLTVSILSMTPYFLESFPEGQIHRSLVTINVSDRLDRYTRGNAIPILRVLLAISTVCRFFCSQVYKSIRLGSILTTEGVPSSDRLSKNFSFNAFPQHEAR